MEHCFDVANTFPHLWDNKEILILFLIFQYYHLGPQKIQYGAMSDHFPKAKTYSQQTLESI